jgi:hypothetical protein
MKKLVAMLLLTAGLVYGAKGGVTDTLSKGYENAKNFLNSTITSSSLNTNYYGIAFGVSERTANCRCNKVTKQIQNVSLVLGTGFQTSSLTRIDSELQIGTSIDPKNKLSEYLTVGLYLKPTYKVAEVLEVYGIAGWQVATLESYKSFDTVDNFTYGLGFNLLNSPTFKISISGVKNEDKRYQGSIALIKSF